MNAHHLCGLLRTLVLRPATLSAILLVLLLSSLSPAIVGSSSAVPSPLPHAGAQDVRPTIPLAALAPRVIRPHTSLIGNWTEGTDYGAATGDEGNGGIPIDDNSCVTNSTYIYCIGGRNFQVGNDYSDVWWANVSENGVVGPWNETIDYGATSGTTGSGGVAVEFNSCVSWTDYVYCVGGSTATGSLSAVYYAQLLSHGVSPWTETIDYGATSGTSGDGGVQSYSPVCAATNGYIYCVTSTGRTSSTYYAQLLTTGVGPWTEGTDYAATSGTSGTGGLDVSMESCAANASYLYCVGGQGPGPSYATLSAVYYAHVSPLGIGAWNETTDVGAWSGDSGTGGDPVWGAGCYTGDDHIFCVGGEGPPPNYNDYENVTYAQLSPSGVGPWSVNEIYFLQDEGTHAPAHLGPFASYYMACILFPGWFHLLHYFGFCTGGGVSDAETAPIGIPAKAAPDLSTTLLNDSVTVGDKFQDSAWLSDESDTAGGTVTYTLYSDKDCSTATGTTDTVDVDNGVVPDSGPFTSVPTTDGFNSILATYSGDDEDEPATAECEPIPVDNAQPSLSTDLSAASVLLGDDFSDAATLSDAYEPAGGTVTYSFYPNDDCSGASTSNDVVTVAAGDVPDSTDFTSVSSTTGGNSILATYSGDANNEPATAECEPITLAAKSPSLWTHISASSVVAGGSFTDSAALSGATSTAGGTVTYRLYSDSACTDATSQSSLVTVTGGVVPGSTSFTASSSAGVESVLATYSGDASNTPATAPCEKVNVTAATPSGPSLSTSLSTTTVANGGTFTAGATLTGVTSSAGGTVTYTLYSDNGCSTKTQQTFTVTVTNGVVPASGQFTAVTPSSQAGQNSVLATYSGDTDNAAATASCVQITVTGSAPGKTAGSSSPFSSLVDLSVISVIVVLVALVAAVALWRRRRAPEPKPEETPGSGAKTKDEADAETSGAKGAGDAATPSPPPPPPETPSETSGS